MSYIGNTQQNQSYVPAVDFFSGDSSTTAFTLSKPVASTAQIQAVISNVPQTPGVAYTVSGSTITFTSAPPSGTNNIYVYYTSPNTQVVQPGQGTVGTTQLADASVTAAKLASGAAIANIGAGGVAQSNLAAGVAGTGPAFSAYGNASISLSNSVWTKVNFGTEDFDTANCYDTSLFRFTPNVAGYYQVNAGVQFSPNATLTRWIGLYKNGSLFWVLQANGGNNSTNYAEIHGSGLVYLNGSTDYIEIYALQNSGTTLSTAGNVGDRFQASFVRAA